MQRDEPIRQPRKPAVLAGLLLLVSATTAAAGTISRWVDAEGVTHFGDGQFAPANAETVIIQPANGMVKPEMSLTPSARGSQGGPVWTKLSLPEKQNVKGWRTRNESLYTGRKHTNRSSRR